MPSASSANQTLLNRSANPPPTLRGTIEFDKNLAKVRADHAPTLLLMLKPTYQAKGIAPAILADVTGIDRKRLGALYNSVGMEEPWLDEAVLLHRALCTAGVRNLICASGSLTDTPMGFATPGDVDALRAGLRLPLSLACRLTVRFGLDDPSELIVSARHMQIWSELESNARYAYDRGTSIACPWCLGTMSLDPLAGRELIGHAPTCLPNVLWGARNVVPQQALGFVPRPQGSTPHRRGFSRKALGIKPLRARLGKTQDQMAHEIGLAADYFSKIERGEMPLNLRHAETIAACYRVSVESLFVAPVQP